MPVQDMLVYCSSGAPDRTPNAVPSGGSVFCGTPAQPGNTGEFIGPGTNAILIYKLAKVEWTLAAPQTDFWFHVVLDQNGGSSIYTDGGIVLSNGATDLFRIVPVNTSGHWKAQYHDGAAWQDVGAVNTTNSFFTGFLLDVHINIADAGGVFEVFVNRATTPAMSLTGDTLFRGVSSVDKITFNRFQSDTSSANYTAIWCPLVADEDTREMTVAYEGAASLGTNQAWPVNAEASIDEEPKDMAVGDYIASGNVAGQKVSYNMAAQDPLFAGHDVVAVVQAVMARATVDGARDLKPLVHKGAADYTLPALGVDGMWRMYLPIWSTDPSTGAAWADQAAVNAAELGLETV